MDLSALADFVLVARHGGIGRAARIAGRSKATLSRRVAELEASLGVRLIERGTRASPLTAEGTALYERSAVLLGELDDVAANLVARTSRPRGPLKISAPLLFSHVVMGRLGAAFLRRHPDIRLEVTAEDRAVDLVEERYDLVIRVNPRPDEWLVGRCFLRDETVVVAAPAIERPAGDASVRAVVLGPAAATSWHLRDATDGRDAIAIEPVLRLSSWMMVREAVVAGAGAALMPRSLVVDDLRAGRVVAWGAAANPANELWVLHASRRLVSRRVAAFLETLAEAFPDGTSEELARFLAAP